jgi:3-deoxy-7-phosphoheptulonate synthase
MIESHLVAGSQSLDDSSNALVYGQSITDACVDWETTKKILRSLATSVAKGRPTIKERKTSLSVQ